MPNTRTTIVVNELLLATAWNYVRAKKDLGEKTDLSKFLNQAILNELERQGDFEIRDKYEEELLHGSSAGEENSQNRKECQGTKGWSQY